MKKKINPSLISKIASRTGGDVLGQADSVKYFIDTGNLAINYVLSGRFINGGVPAGKIIEIFGPESSSKSLIGMNILGGCQKIGGIPVILDCENSSNAEFAEKASHIDTSCVIRYTPRSLEEAFINCYNVINDIRKEYGKEVPIVIVYDSITVSPCERELREVDLPPNYTQADFKKIVGGKEQPGERAKICSKELRKITPILQEQDVTFVVLNQIRSKVGVFYGNPETSGGGGNALKFYASCRVRTQTQAKIEDKNLKMSQGVNIKVVNKKNKTFRPFIETEQVKLFFRSGIDPLSGLLSLLRQDRKIVQISSGNFAVAPQFLPEGVGEYKFKGSLTRNDIALKVLQDCPALVGAQNMEEISNYVQPFEAAMATSGINESDLGDVATSEEDIDQMLGLHEDDE